jgi:O-antigen/teichoic acid export membrane protein
MTVRLFKRLGEGLPNTLLLTAGTAAAGLCSGVLLGRTLVPLVRGEFATVLLWPGALVLFGDLGLGFAFSYYGGQHPDKLNGLWTMACVVSAAWGGLLALGGALVFPHLVHLSAVGYACLLWNLITVPIVLLTGYATFFLLGSNRIFEFNLVRLVSAWLYALGILAVASAHRASVASYTLVYIMSQALACALAVALVIRQLRPKFHLEPGLAKPVFVYGGKTYLSSLAAQANLRMDQLLMSSWLVLDQLGWYVVAVSFASMISPLFNALAVVTLPRVTRAADLKAGGRQIARHVQLAMALGLPTMGVVIIAAPQLLPLFFGDRYLPSVPLARILVVGAVFQGANVILGNGLRGLGLPGKTALSEGAGLVVTIVLLVSLLPAYGALGAACASLSACSLVAVIQLSFIRRAVGMKWSEFLAVSRTRLFAQG